MNAGMCSDVVTVLRSQQAYNVSSNISTMIAVYLELFGHPVTIIALQATLLCQGIPTHESEFAYSVII